MGDMPEPKYHTTDRDNTSVMSRVSATLGRNFIRTKDFQDAQIMSMEAVIHYNQLSNSTKISIKFVYPCDLYFNAPLELFLIVHSIC